MRTWRERAWHIINHVHDTLPPDASDRERRKAIQAAYPWGLRYGWPYKAWCKAQREYFARLAPPDPSKSSPLAEGLFAPRSESDVGQ